MCINTDHKQYLVHILLAKEFIENKDNKLFVNHKDGKKSNNVIDNLEWVTRSENAIHAIETGLNKCGKKIAIYDENDNILNIYRSCLDASNNLKISRKSIRDCCKGSVIRKDGKIFKYLDN